MPYEESRYRSDLRTRSRDSRPTGQIAETQHPVRQGTSEDISFRDQAIFLDQTDLSIIGFGLISGMTT